MTAVSGKKTEESLAALEERIGYHFKNGELLREAMTHSSYSHEWKGDKKPPCNERLEFLGDSVLSLIVSEYLYSKYPDCPEGDLTRMRSEIVRGDTALSNFAEKIGIGNCLFLGNGEEASGGRCNKKILEDAFEALVAAVFLDAGSDDNAKEAVRSYLIPLAEEKIAEICIPGKGRVVDYKTQLQEVVQKNSRGERLEYVTVDERGPDHAKTFTVEARIDSNVFGKGEGRRIKDAEQMAARHALITLGEIADSDNE